MKKVSILALHLGYGGIEKCISSLANILCEKYQVEIAVCYKMYDKPAFNIDERVKIKYLNNKKIIPNKEKFKQAFKDKKIITMFKEGLFSLKVLHLRRKNMINYIKKCKSDIIISTRDIFNYWLCDFCDDHTIKIGWEHNHYHDNYKYASNITNSAKRLDYLVLVSSDLQKFYDKELKNSKCVCVYIPNTIDKIPSVAAPLEKKRLVSVGRLSPEKGFLDLLKIYSKIIKDHPDWTLDIIGEGSERTVLEDYIKEHKLEDKVTLHGFQGKEYIDKILHDSSIYLMTSYTESFGIVLIEAMSHGVPCVAFDSAEGAREIIQSGNNGYLVKHRNFDAYVLKVNSLIDKKEERKRIGKLARESVDKYTGDKVGSEWISLLEESGVYE